MLPTVPSASPDGPHTASLLGTKVRDDTVDPRQSCDTAVGAIGSSTGMERGTPPAVAVTVRLDGETPMLPPSDCSSAYSLTERGLG